MKRRQQTLEAKQLINRIHAETKMRGWNLHNTAQELGISHIYLASLTSGARKVSGLSLEKQRKLAKFLGISLVEFFMQCGILRPEDFPVSTPA